MFSLRGQATGPGRPETASGGVRLVLPRLLRRPVRLLVRFTTGELKPPRFAALTASALLLGASAAYGAYLGGHVPAVMQAVTSRTGLAVDSIHITGNVETSELDVLDQLQLDGWTSLVGYDAEEARARIEALPWVAEAAVRKIYPDALDIRIREKKAFALWQHDRQLSIVERDGTIIAPFGGGRHGSLPLVIGAGAEKRAAEFVELVGGVPELAARVRGHVRVGNRRWDLRLENGVTVKLPESGEAEALAALAALDRESAILSRDVLSIDLRLGDRTVVKLTPGALERRETAFKDAAKAARKKTGRKA